MKKLPLYAMVLLMIQWLGCQQSETSTAPGNTEKPATASTAEMIIPESKDTTLPSGRHNTYIISSRDKPGIFVERSDFPAGYVGEPHVHNEVLYVTILKGSVYMAFSDKLDTTLPIKPAGPGSFIIIPADKAHFEWFKEDCSMQIEGMGPQSTYFIKEKK